jgi:hypothetical protein
VKKKTQKGTGLQEPCTNGRKKPVIDWTLPEKIVFEINIKLENKNKSHILASSLKSYERKFSHEKFSPDRNEKKTPKTRKWIPGSAITPPKKGKGRESGKT